MISVTGYLFMEFAIIFLKNEKKIIRIKVFCYQATYLYRNLRRKNGQQFNQEKIYSWLAATEAPAVHCTWT